MPQAESPTRAPDRCFASIAALRCPQKTAWAPTPLAYRGPVSLLAKLLRNLQRISQRRKRLAFAPAASDVRFSDCVKRLFRSGIGAATALRPQSGRGHALWSGGVMATPTFCHALPTARRLRRLDSLALCDVKTFSPEHGPCQIKFFRWSQRPMRQNEARPARTARSASSSWARGKPKYASTPSPMNLATKPS